MDENIESQILLWLNDEVTFVGRHAMDKLITKQQMDTKFF